MLVASLRQTVVSYESEPLNRRGGGKGEGSLFLYLYIIMSPIFRRDDVIIIAVNGRLNKGVTKPQRQKNKLRANKRNGVASNLCKCNARLLRKFYP